VTALGDLDRARIGELYAQELARFRADRPWSPAMISRARDVTRYLEAHHGLLAQLG